MRLSSKVLSCGHGFSKFLFFFFSQTLSWKRRYRHILLKLVNCQNIGRLRAKTLCCTLTYTILHLQSFGWKGIMVLVKSISFPATHWGISYGGWCVNSLVVRGLSDVWLEDVGPLPPYGVVWWGPRGPGSTRPELIELCRTSAFAAVMLCMDSFSYCATRVNRAHNPFLLRFQA